MKLLIIEDEPKVVAFLKEGLEEKNFIVEYAYDGATGQRLALTKDYHLIILDVILPDHNGMDICRNIKKSKPNMPILLLTALGTTDDKVKGFDYGADDYMVKPFAFMELVARIKALTKRINVTASDNSEKIEVADLVLDQVKKIAVRNGKQIPLTAKEYLLLNYFMTNSGRVIPRAELAERVWDLNFDTGTNTVEVYINILRKKIDKDSDTKLIHTRIGLGYIFTDQP